MQNKEVRIHPTQKPVELFTAILQDYAKAKMKIFDPFMGSGTTAIAAARLKQVRETTSSPYKLSKSYKKNLRINSSRDL